MARPQQQRNYAPEGSISTFLSNLEEVLRAKDKELRFTRTYFGKRSGSITSHLLNCFEFFQLSTAEGAPTDRFRQMEDASSEQFAPLFHNAYSRLIDSLNQRQSDDLLRLIEIYPIRKSAEEAVRFFLSSARHAGYAVPVGLAARKPQEAVHAPYVHTHTILKVRFEKVQLELRLRGSLEDLTGEELRRIADVKDLLRQNRD